MKKEFKALAVFAMASLLVVSCAKEEQSVPEAPGTATVKGMAYANIDETNDTTATGAFQTQYEAAPNGTKIIFSIDGYDLDPTPDNSYNYQTQYYTASVSSGAYTIALPALNYSEYDYVSDDFTATVINSYTGITANTSVETFEANDNDVEVTEGEVVIRDLYFSY